MQFKQLKARPKKGEKKWASMPLLQTWEIIRWEFDLQRDKAMPRTLGRVSLQQPLVPADVLEKMTEAERGEVSEWWIVERGYRVRAENQRMANEAPAEIVERVTRCLAIDGMSAEIAAALYVGLAEAWAKLEVAGFAPPTTTATASGQPTVRNDDRASSFVIGTVPTTAN